MGKFSSNWLIRDKKCGENVCSILYAINLFERCDQYEKMFISKTILVFDFTSVYQILYKIGSIIEKLKMFDTWLPIFIPPKCVRGRFSRRVNFFPNKYAETNISAKFDAFIRNMNVCIIFYYNSPDYMYKSRKIYIGFIHIYI